MKLLNVALFVAVLFSLVTLAACRSSDKPAEETEVRATTAPAPSATPVPTSTTEPTATPAPTSQPAAATAAGHSSPFDSTKYENVWVQAIEEIEHDGRSLLRVSYPVTEQDTINARMEAITQEFIDEWRTTAAEIEASYQEYKKETGTEAATFISHYRQHFDVSIANENVIFFDIVRSIHTGGTGISFVVGYIFDRRTGAELTIHDLFEEDRFLERLSSLTREILTERTRQRFAEWEFKTEEERKEALEFALKWIEDGTSPTAENLDNILLREDGTALVRFDKYQVAAGAFGVVEVEFPLSAIADLVKPEYRQVLGLGTVATEPATQACDVVELEVSENDDRSTLFVSYPLTEQNSINVRIEAITQQFIDKFHITAAEIEKEYQDYKKKTGQEAASFVTHFRQDHEVELANEKVMFFTVTRTEYTGGTGNTLVSSYIFDLRSGAEITIPNLFVDDSYLQRLSELSREALAERLRNQIAEREPDADDDRMKELFESEKWVLDPGTEPKAENFDFIVFRGDGTVLLRFDKYQVGSGVEGVVEIELAIAAIADLLRPEIRDLLGIPAETTTRSPRTARAASPSQSVVLSPAFATTNPSAAVYRNFPNSLTTLFSKSKQTETAAQDEINCNEVACVALTFDDGPSYYTEGLLDTLKEHNVKATFFVLGTQVRVQSETVQRMFQEGHQIGNHTWDHPNLTKMPAELIREQLKRTDDLITQLIGEPTPFLRPPYGAYNESVLAASGMPIIFWSVDPLDWKDRDAQTVAARIADSPAGAIILAHDIHKSTVDAVPAIIAALKGRGIHFVTVSKLFEPLTLLPQNVYIRQTNSPSQ